jgi:hypothetical protein
MTPNSSNLPNNLKGSLSYDTQVPQIIPDTNNYLTSNRFVFNIKRIPTLNYFCQRATLPGIQFGTSLQSAQTGISPIRRPGTQYQQDELIIGFLVDENIKNWLEIFNWMKQAGSYDKTYETLKEEHKVSDAFLVIMNSAMAPVATVTFYDIFPVEISTINFDSSVSDADPILAQASFAYSWYDIKTSA